MDRTRVVAAELATLEPESPHYQAWAAQIQPLQVRAHMLLKVGGSIAAYYGQQFLFEAGAGLAVLTGASAIFCLAAGCALTVRETQIAVHNLEKEAEIRIQYRTPSNPK